MTEKLKPCPFCGGELESTTLCIEQEHNEDFVQWLSQGRLGPVSNDYRVYCYHCGSHGPAWITKEKAIECWNER